MIVISKMKDGLYNVSNGEDLKCNYTKELVIAVCFWVYKIRKDTINNALEVMDSSNNDMIIFHNDTDYHIAKIDYSKTLT